MKIVDRFGSRPGAELVCLPQGGERLLAVEHAAALLVNEQTAFRVVCTPELLPQLALGRLLTEGWIASADEVEQVAVCAEGLKVSVHLTHPLAAAPAAGQEVPSCCTDNLTVETVQRPDLEFRDLVAAKSDRSGVSGLWRVRGWRLHGSRIGAPGTMTVRMQTRSLP